MLYNNAQFDMYFMYTGAGMHVTNSKLSYSSSSLPNNSIILADTTGYSSWSHYRRMGFYCCSNYTSAGQDGIFIGLNSITYSGRISIIRYSSSQTNAGCMELRYTGYDGFPETSEQGIYTCRMPDAAGEYIDVSVGIYREDYSGKSN